MTGTCHERLQLPQLFVFSSFLVMTMPVEKLPIGIAVFPTSGFGNNVVYFQKIV
jgi:hypothetical protein